MSDKKCERCGSGKKCCSIFMSYRMGLVRLCSDCHEAYHDMVIKAEEQFLKRIKIMRLIDADALKEEVNKKKIVGRFNTLCLIDKAPTVEAHPYYCNHIFDKYIRVADPKRMCITFHLKCMLCNKTTSLNVTSGMLANLFSDITLNHINPIYVKAVSNENPCDQIK